MTCHPGKMPVLIGAVSACRRGCAPGWGAGLARGWAVGSRDVSPRWGTPAGLHSRGLSPHLTLRTRAARGLFPWLPPQGDITALPAAWGHPGALPRGPPGGWCQCDRPQGGGRLCSKSLLEAGWVGPQGTGGASLSRGRRRSLSSHSLGAGQLWSPGSRHQEGVSRVGLMGGRGGERGGVGRGADIWGGEGRGRGEEPEHSAMEMARRLVQTPSPHRLRGDQPLWAQPQASNEARRSRGLGAAACWLHPHLQAGFSARPALAQHVAFPVVWA